MNLGKFAVQAIKEWNPLSPEAYARRDRNKAFRKARRKAKRGETLTQDEEIVMAQQTATVTLPSGETIARTEPRIPLRTSTKVGVVGLLVPLLSVIPFYDEINGLLLQACQSENGPTVFLGGAAVAWASAVVTARLSKSPAKPGAL